jgi:hypothetical protein
LAVSTAVSSGAETVPQSSGGMASLPIHVGKIRTTDFIEIAKLSPSVSLIPQSIIPINSPTEFKTGPPLFPGFVGASICMNGSKGRKSNVTSSLLMCPALRLMSSPRGKPITETSSPVW